MTAGTADWVGQLIDKRYRVSKLIGEGGMGFVYVANDARLSAKVVLKVPRVEMLADAEFRQRFVDEVRALVKLSHPHIVKVTDFGSHRETPFAVLQFLPGGSLEDRRPRDPQNRVKAVAASSLPGWLPAVADALDYIHAQGYIHRDIKPGNILFDAEKHAFISDFGVAKAAGTKQTQRQQNLTGVGNIIGTPEYLAPEVVLGQPFDGRIDQYALAVTVYELLTGRVPFQGGAATATLVMHTRDTAPRLDLVRANVPPALASAVERALAKTPAEQFPNCTAFAQACLAGLAGKAAHGAPTPPIAGTVRETLGEVQAALTTPANTPRGVPPRKSNLALILGLAFGGLVLVGGIAAAVVLSMKRDAPPEPPPAAAKLGPPPAIVVVPIPVPGKLADGPFAELKKSFAAKAAASPVVLHVRVAPTALTLQAGGKAESVEVFPTRHGTEPVTVALDAPAGLTATPPQTLPAGVSSARFSISAVAGTPAGARPLGVSAKTASQANPAVATVTVTVRAPSFSVASPADRTVRAGAAEEVELTVDRAGGYDGPVTFRVESSNVVDGQTVAVPAGQTRGIVKLAVKESAPNGPSVVAVKAEAADAAVAAVTVGVKLRVVSFQKLAEFAGHDGAITALAFDVDGKRVLAGTATGSVYCRDLGRPEKAVWDVAKHAGRVDAVAFSADGKLALSGGEDKTVYVWDAATGAVQVRLHGNEHKQGIWHAYFLRPGSPVPVVQAKQQVKATPADVAVSVSPDRTVYWDVKAGKPLEVYWKTSMINKSRSDQRFLNDLPGQAKEPAAQVDYGGGFALAGLGGDKLEVYQGKQVRVAAPGNGGAIQAFAVNADASRAATAGADGQIRLWEMTKTAAKLAPGFPWKPDAAAAAVALSPDGTRMIVGGDDKSVRLYKLP